MENYLHNHNFNFNNIKVGDKVILIHNWYYNESTFSLECVEKVNKTTFAICGRLFTKRSGLFWRTTARDWGDTQIIPFNTKTWECVKSEWADKEKKNNERKAKEEKRKSMADNLIRHIRFMELEKLEKINAIINQL